MVEMHMSAVKAMCRWLAWRGAAVALLLQSHPAAPHRAARGAPGAAAALQLPAGRHADRRRLAGPALAARQPGRRARRRASRPRGFLVAVYDYLIAHIRCAPTLEQTAAAFGVSPATLEAPSGPARQPLPGRARPGARARGAAPVPARLRQRRGRAPPRLS
ncbi:hypothetical protein LP420_07630 [Massilia sp. B-10]|nr:hypothetical protein LP420_07630 [Massilia sp. B-10]